MKKILPIFITILFLATTVSAISGIHSDSSRAKTVAKSSVVTQPTKTIARPAQKISAQPTQEINIGRPATVLAQEQTPTFYPPKLLNIPKIGLNANVVPVGLDSQNRMDVPNNFIEVGWYNLGSKPGEKGSVVLAGHYDDFKSNPAVLYYLSRLEKGDKVLVTDQSNKEFTYVVSDKIIYPYDQLPLQQIFTANDKARLNIITCQGEWDSAREDYSGRTVIYSELQA